MSFRDKIILTVYRGVFAKHLPKDILPRTLNKLRMLDAAERPEDLQIPPPNRLEALKGKRVGQWAVHINDQWRICFVWKKKTVTPTRSR